MSFRSAKHRRLKSKEAEELNITSFLNLMVILIPFLLITAVFSRMTVLELNIPPAPPKNEQNKKPKKEFQLVVTIRKNALVVGDTQGGLIKRIIRLEEAHDYESLTGLLKRIKVRFPKKTTVSILLEPDIPYNTLVQVMDAVRITTVVEAGVVAKAELFPDISIGDAQILAGSN